MRRIGIRTKLNKGLWTFLAKKKLGGYGKNLGVYHKCLFSTNTFVKNDCHFNGMEIKGNGHVSIGSHFHSGRNCVIITHIHNYEGTALPYDNIIINKDVIIGKNVWIGDNVIILGGANIEDGAIVQAGSVVVGKVPYCSIVGGHPAKPFKYRNINHYEELAEKQND